MANKVIPFEKRKSTKKSDADEFYVDRRKWTDALCENLDISHTAHRVGCFIAKKTNAKDKVTWWTVAKIAKCVGCNKNSVSASTKRLVQLGLLEVTKNSDGKHNIYRILFPWR